MNYDKTGAFIKELRIESNLSQSDIARKFNIGRENISKWENGKALPDVSNLVLLSDIFHITVDEILLGDHVTKENKKDIENMYLQLYDERNNAQKKLKRTIKLLLTSIIILATFSIIFLYLVFFYN